MQPICNFLFHLQIFQQQMLHFDKVNKKTPFHFCFCNKKEAIATLPSQPATPDRIYCKYLPMNTGTNGLGSNSNNVSIQLINGEAPTIRWVNISTCRGPSMVLWSNKSVSEKSANETCFIHNVFRFKMELFWVPFFIICKLQPFTALLRHNASKHSPIANVASAAAVNINPEPVAFNKNCVQSSAVWLWL